MRPRHHRPPGNSTGQFVSIAQPERGSAHKAARFAAASAGVALALTGATTARAHEAPSGWMYPYECCSGYDCRPVSSKWIKESGGAFIIPTTGEAVPYSDKRIRTSPDGEFHWCSVAGSDDGKTICLFVPQRMF
ncbi:hypothetical protein [Oricola nitratireducens]|uniref:hypothetical protein n=1 Tax=Oricola nitratireducens TaxID=2775868 RepID=UPI003D177C8E